MASLLLPVDTRLSLDAICVPGSAFFFCLFTRVYGGHLFRQHFSVESLDAQVAFGAQFLFSLFTRVYSGYLFCSINPGLRSAIRKGLPAVFYFAARPAVDIFFVNITHVAADGISSEATFCKSSLSLILSQLLSASKPMVLKLIFAFWQASHRLP